jgi:O-antigen/teichoic acid export membrane protein
MEARQSLKGAIIKNASANLVRMAASGIVALVVPPFLTRMLPTETYGTWALLLQVTTYAGFLDLGIQTAVARFVAHAEELNDPDQRDGIASTAFALLTVIAVLSLCLVWALAWQLPHIFKGMPVSLHGDARVALLLMGGSFAIGLPVAVFHAIFIGQQRNKIPVSILIANKSIAALLTIVVVSRHAGIATMGAGVALANVLSYAASYVAWRVYAPYVRLRKALASWWHAKQIAGYSAALGVWSFGMLLVSGLDLTIVGIFDFAATAYYAVAIALTNFVVQAQNAIFAAVMPASAVLNARGDSERLRILLLVSTRYGMFILLASSLPLLLAGRFILGIWVGSSYAMHSAPIMLILVIANVVRLSFLPYATLLLGAGEHKKVLLSPLAEGITNLVASVVGAAWFGAIGVAIGTLIGSLVSVSIHLFYNMPRTKVIPVDRTLLVKEGLLRPLLCAAPCSLLLVFHEIGPQMKTRLPLVLIGFTVLCTAYLIWKWGLINSERQKLGNVFHI